MSIITTNWQQDLLDAIDNVEDLKKYITLNEEENKLLKKIIKLHPMLITKYYLSLVNPLDQEDPIKRMIIPSLDELNVDGNYDTSGEKSNTKEVGLQHKYAQTALILTTNQCSTYCRYCFRKRFVGVKNDEIVKNFDDVINYIENNKNINNVLLSGGDSFMLDTEVIADLLERLTKIQHLTFIRFGTKIPVVFPDRILKDQDLLKVLKHYSTKTNKIYVVTQFNHPVELTEKAIAAANLLQEANVIINNQTILMKKVNDTPEILAGLLTQLTAIGITPYYVFQCRPVKRVLKHFQISLEEGCKLVEDTKKQLNGCAKRFKFVMSHRTGKIEILGKLNDKMLFKYHQAKNPKNCGKIFDLKLEPGQAWLQNIPLKNH